jgi:hypothetical protein
MDKNEKVEEEARGEEAVKAQKKELDFFPESLIKLFFASLVLIGSDGWSVSIIGKFIDRSFNWFQPVRNGLNWFYKFGMDPTGFTSLEWIKLVLQVWNGSNWLYKFGTVHSGYLYNLEWFRLAQQVWNGSNWFSK